MVKCKLVVGNEEKEVMTELALESSSNVKRRKILVPICIVLGVILILSGVMCIVNKDIGNGVFFLIMGVFITLWGVNAKNIQKVILHRLQKKSDKNLTGGERDYVFSEEGVSVTSKFSNGMNYWNAFKTFGKIKHYIYLRMIDNKIVLVDANKLSEDELNELYRLIQNIKG